MSNWHPKPLRPEDSNPLFSVGEDWSVKKSLSPIEKQRLIDGTPHTKYSVKALSPSEVEPIDGPNLYLNKAQKPEKKEEPKKLDPDEVVKSFLKAMPYDTEREDEEKGMGSAAVEGAKKLVGTAVDLGTNQ